MDQQGRSAECRLRQSGFSRLRKTEMSIQLRYHLREESSETTYFKVQPDDLYIDGQFMKI